jgi:hypothetical protein
MFLSKLNSRAAVLVRSVGLGVGLAGSWWIALAGSPDRSERPASEAKKTAAGIAADQFDTLRALIKPKPGGFDDVPWMTDLWQARKKATAEGKPLLVWVGDGHPLGWT